MNASETLLPYDYEINDKIKETIKEYLSNNEKIESLVNWPLHISCNGFTQNSTFNYKGELDIVKLLPKEGQTYTTRLSFPPPPAVVHPCKQHTINSCPRYI